MGTPGPYTAEQLARHADTIQSIAECYVPIMRQFQAQNVLDIWTAGYITFRQELDRLGVDMLPPDTPYPAPLPPSAGDVTLTWDAEDWRRLAEYLRNQDEPVGPEDVEAALAIREQLDTAR